MKLTGENPTSFPPPLTGDRLRQALTMQAQERPALLEGLLHERTVVLIASEPGIGKSLLFIQLAAQGSIAQEVFGLFPARQPLRVYYLMSERDIWEPLDRLQRFEAHIPFNVDNIILDADCVGMRLTKENHLEFLLHRVLNTEPDLVIVDPIYGFFEGGIAGDEVAIRVGWFSTRLLRESSKPLGIILGHHNVKNIRQLDMVAKTWMDKENPFYGSQFLKAYVTGYYDLSKDKEGTVWRRKKDTYGILHPDFRLVYDPLTGLSYFPREPAKLDKRDHLRLFIQQQVGRPFTPSDMLKAVPMTERYLRLLLKDSEIMSLLRVVSENGNITLYETVTSS